MCSIFIFIFLTSFFIKSSNPQFVNENLPSVSLQENNSDDATIQIFNKCKCVIFYMCDEENFIIPPDQLANTKVALNNSMRPLRRLRCSNDFYYCCRNSSTLTTPTGDVTTVAQTPKCGQGSQTPARIIDEFPWTVAIYQSQQSQYVFKCAGTLIHPRVVLTGQHCVISSTANTLKVVTRKKRVGPSITPVFKIIKHENFYSGGLHNDASLLILASSLPNINPICLPQPGQNFSGQTCVAVGWGEKANIRFKKVTLPIIGAQTCQNLLRNTSLGPDFVLHPSFVCGGGEEEQDICRGAGGGPLMCPEGDGFVQVGIVSWGVGCGQRNVPGLYTNVANVVGWIRQKVAEENLEF